MRLADLFALAWDNLRRNRTRSLLTGVGVMIGVAALLTLLSYGAGLQHNARSEFNALELYNTLRVTSTPSPISGMGELAVRTGPSRQVDDPVPLTDSLLAAIGALDGVQAAYPEVLFPGQLTRDDRRVIVNVEAIPLAFQSIPSYQPVAGHFFETADENAVLIGPSMARRLGFEPAEAAVGQTVALVTASLDARKLRSMSGALLRGLTGLPVSNQVYEMTVAGLLAEDQQPVSGFTRVLMPLERARDLRKVTFFSTLDLVLRGGTTEGYAAARVQLADDDALSEVRAEIEDLGVFATSFREQFGKLEQLFLVLDLALGIVGVIALIIATVGIANTIMMNVRERVREIGVMKAVGGEERDVQRLFVVEGALLGGLGGVAGLLFGYGVIALLNLAVNWYLYTKGVPSLDVFYSTPLMAAGIFGTAVLISLGAGVFPARRAARIEPVAALRST